MGDPATLNLLAIDTSTEEMSVALTCRGQRSHWQGPGGAQASSQLIPRIDALMRERGLLPAQLDAVAFGCGPGAFTGLRTACAVAQGLALGAGCPVIPVDSLLIVAQAARAALPGPARKTLEVGVAMDARMGELYAARYIFAAGHWQVVDVPMLVKPQALLRRWEDSPEFMAGSGVGLLGDHLAADACVADDRASALLHLAVRQWEDAGVVEAARALPVYLRDQVALTTLERQARVPA